MCIFWPPAVNNGADVEAGGICKEMYVLYVQSGISDQEEE